MQYFDNAILTAEYGFISLWMWNTAKLQTITFKLKLWSCQQWRTLNALTSSIRVSLIHSTFLLMHRKIYNPSVTFKACRGVRLDTIIITFWSCSASDCKSQGCKIIEPQYPLYSSSSACCQGPGKKTTTHICATSEGDKALAELHRDENVRNGRGLGELWSSRT